MRGIGDTLPAVPGFPAQGGSPRVEWSVFGWLRAGEQSVRWLKLWIISDDDAGVRPRRAGRAGSPEPDQPGSLLLHHFDQVLDRILWHWCPKLYLSAPASVLFLFSVSCGSVNPSSWDKRGISLLWCLVFDMFHVKRLAIRLF